MPAGDELKQAKRSAIRYLGYRERSVEEVRAHLVKKEFPKAVIRQTLNYLQDIRYLDDERFAKNFSRSKMETKHLGRFRLRRELRAKGIDPDLAERVLDELYHPGDEYDLARSCAEKKMKSWKGLDRQKQKQRMAQFLQRKGFSGDTIYKTLDHLIPS